jgi:hypothetical protein
MNKCLCFKWLLETRNGSLLLDRNHRWLTPPPLHPTYHTTLPLSFPFMPYSFTYRSNFFCISLPFSSFCTTPSSRLISSSTPFILYDLSLPIYIISVPHSLTAFLLPRYSYNLSFLFLLSLPLYS